MAEKTVPAFEQMRIEPAAVELPVADSLVQTAAAVLDVVAVGQSTEHLLG